MSSSDSSVNESRKMTLHRILHSPILAFGYDALHILIDEHQREPRGKMQGTSITLSARIPKDSEFIKLFIHELSHYIDIYALRSTGEGIDPSERFYDISWIDTSTKKSGEGLQSFVSGYAATNKYEDFAESLTMYMFHNREFADRALKNDSLRQKYLFYSRYLFRRGEFMDTDFRIGIIPSYFWDTTKIPISVQKYLYSLRESI